MGIFAGVGTALSIYGAYEQYQSGKESRKIAQENAANILAESKESARRVKKDQEQILAETKARAAASGVQGGGTVDVYLSEMRKNFDLEQDWIKKSGESRASIALSGGKQQERMAKVSAWGTITSGLGKLY